MEGGWFVGLKMYAAFTRRATSQAKTRPGTSRGLGPGTRTPTVERPGLSSEERVSTERQEGGREGWGEGNLENKTDGHGSTWRQPYGVTWQHHGDGAGEELAQEPYGRTSSHVTRPAFPRLPLRSPSAMQHPHQALYSTPTNIMQSSISPSA